MSVTTLYASITDVENRLSAGGVTSRTDDIPPTTYGDVLDEASRNVDEYAYMLYEGNLGLSSVVRHWTANIAAFLLCERRGNPVPVGIASKYERTLKALEQVAHNGRLIPDIAQMKSVAPVLSNVHAKLTPFPHTVVERVNSTGKQEGYRQHRDLTGLDNYADAYVI